MNNITPETLSTLPEVNPATESGVFAWGYDRDNPSKLVRFPASGGGATGSKGLLATVTNNTGDFEFIHFVDVYFDWNVVSQTQPIYNTTTGIYTLPETGLYWMQLDVIASIPDNLSGGVAVYKNNVGIYGASFAVLYGDAVIQQGFPFEAQAGDQIHLSSMVNSPDNGGGPLQEAPSKIQLFKL